jgi:hypothetical protein
VLVAAALVVLFVFDVSWLFWVLIGASLVVVALDFWERRRFDR